MTAEFSPGDGSAGLDEQETTLVFRAREKSAGLRTAAHLPQQKRVSLLVTEGPMKGQSIPITKAQVLLGRPQTDGQTAADIVINDPQVSRKHCVLEIHGLSALLVDLDSVNGTFVNRRKIASCELKTLSEFQIGATNLVLAII